MNTTELKKLADMCISLPLSRSTTEIEDAGTAIIELLAINAELVEALKEAFSMLGSRLIKDTFGYEWHEKAYAALAKAEGGEL